MNAVIRDGVEGKRISAEPYPPSIGVEASHHGARDHLAANDPSSELPFHEYVRQCLGGSPSGVEVFPKPDRIRKLRFSIGSEAPLVLVDDTVMQSCKAGVLLTTHALYLLSDGRRLDLSHVRGGPYYPRGADEAGYVETVHGPFPFAPLTQLETRSALERIVEVVLKWARGDRSSPYAALAMRGPISNAAVHTLLSSPRILPPWNIGSKKRHGLHVVSRGMDHLGGEEVLAVIDETMLGTCDEGVVFTDRAVHVRSSSASAPNDAFVVPYATIMGVTPKSGMMSRGVKLMTTAGAREITLISKSETADAVARFLAAVVAFAPMARRDPPPSGAPVIEDSRSLAQLGGHGLDPETTFDLRSRLFLQQQNERWGRGVSEGWPLSPLSIGDLRVALAHVLGPSQGEHWDGRVLTLDCALRRAGSGAGAAVASSAVGFALLATVGVGWVSLPKGPSITSVRVRLCELRGGTGITVTGLAGREVAAPEVARAVDEKLLLVEREVLRRRCAFGPAVDPHALLSIKSN